MPADPFARVRRAASAKTVAEKEYRSAIVALVDMLEQHGTRDAYARVARELGVRRQTVRVLVDRARAR